mmetsp:Transcript_41432/g.99251  ORF Transcript_41432/g.99251 Transcript_41432/m.99251 type:complete len:547 (-) Transcript_41432:60-1700(-)
MTMTMTTMMMYPCHYLSSISGYALGLLFIFVVAIIWALASVLVQYLYNDTDFDAPFLLTYVGTSLFTVLLPLHWLCSSSNDSEKLCCAKKTTFAATTTNANARIRQGQAHGHGHATSFERRIHDSDIIQTDDDDNDIDDNDERYHDEVDDEADDDDDSRRLLQQQPQQPQHDATATEPHHQTHHHHQSFSVTATTPLQKWTNRDHMVAALKIAPMWFISNFAYNASLRYTSITSSTVLVNMGSLFTFLFAVMMRDEHFNWFKVVGVACGIGGSILTGLHDYRSDDDDNELKGDGNGNGSIFMDNDPDDGSHQQHSLGLIWGDVLSVISAVFYGVYAVMVRVLCPHDESLMSMQLFLGYVGLWNMIALGPIAIYHIAGGGGGNSSTASTLSLWIVECLVLKGLFDNVISDYLWARAVVLTSATVATVGLGLTIPLAFVSDVFLGRPDVLNFQSITGAVAVLTGFVLVNLGQKKDDDEYNHPHPHPHHDHDGNPHDTIRRTTSNELGLASPSSLSSSSSSYHGHDQELPEVATRTTSRRDLLYNDGSG